MRDESSAKDLCLRLMSADSEEEVIDLLKRANYWDDPTVWRFYGDYENNYNTIGNQQSRPDAALVEKLVNAVDARLMNECLVRGLNPENENAPQDILEAVARFFDNVDNKKISLAGRIREWPESKRREIARGITLAATGARPPASGNPSFTIVDSGEGQTPDQIPNTVLSLNKSNKLRIPFVQGKFNMGGTGVLKFCGKHNFQLVLSRRNPAILKIQNDSQLDDNKWGFTVVRREDPKGNRRSSVYTYLAPCKDRFNSNQGAILRFFSEELPIFPEGEKAYSRKAGWGTLIKLYEYSTPGFRSDILRKDGLLSRVDLLLPDIALPMRFHECRGYGGHGGSHDTTLTGVRVRLEDDKGKNLEDGFPVGAPIKVAGEEIVVTIYAFKKGGSEAYRKNEGIIFVVNGQTHGQLTQDFFSRKKVGLSYLADSLLVIADCSKLSGRAREDLFMNSRDRLSGGELRQLIEDSFEELLKQHQGLRDLKERRRREEIASKLDNSKPLEDILENLLKQSPTLANLFLQGIRASTPFKTIEAQTAEHEFEGVRFPTYFKFKGKEYGQELHRDCHINMRCRLTFETDAENEYFSRTVDHGSFILTIQKENNELEVQDYVLNLQNGIASLSVPMPNSATVGEKFIFFAKIQDCSRIEPFLNKFSVTVKDKQETKGETSTRRKPPGEENGKDRERPAGIQIREPIEVFEPDWDSKPKKFNKYTAMWAIDTGYSGESDENEDYPSIYDFYVNMDNIYLKSELKISKLDPQLLRAQFKYAMVLLGLGLLHQSAEKQKTESENIDEATEIGENGANIENKIEDFCRAVAPVVIPMINSLGSISFEDEVVLGASGEAT